jgi:hypothetical protein
VSRKVWLVWICSSGLILWLDGVPLIVRLFELTENQSSSVAEMCLLAWGAGGEAWGAGETVVGLGGGNVGRVSDFTSPVFLQVQSPDTWQWQPDLVRGYSVCGAYQLLTSRQLVPQDAVADLIWHWQVPLKVTVFAWRLLRDRLPTKVNLANRGIISPEALACVSGCSGMFGSLWPMVRSWIGFSFVESQTLSDHFLQFKYSSGGPRARRSFLQLIWLLCVWIVLTERNHRLFRNSELSVSQLLDKVKLHFYWWLKTTNISLVSNYHSRCGRGTLNLYGHWLVLSLIVIFFQLVIM